MRKLALLLAAVAVAIGTASAVSLERGEKRWNVANGHYRVGFNANQGYCIGWIRVGSVEKSITGRFAYGYDMQPTSFTKLPPAPDEEVSRLGATIAVEKETPEEVVVKVTWGDANSQVTETYAFDDSPTVGCTVDLSWKRVIGSLGYRLNVSDGQVDAARARYFPEGRGYAGIYETERQGQHSALPRWKHFKEGESFGFGVVAAETSRWENFMFATRPAAKGFWSTRAWVDLVAEHLAGEAVPNSRRYEFKLVLAADEQVTHRVANAALASAPAVQLCDIVPDKVVAKRGQGNGLTTTVVNNAETSRTVRVKVELASGLDNVRTVSETTLALEPLEMREFKASWTNDASAEWGVASRVSVLDDATGERLDYRADVTAVHDRGFAAAAVGIVNAGNCIQGGAESAWADHFRRSYIGMVEYYVWSPSTWDPSRKAGQAPEADSWEPCTESSTGYRTRVTKSFLRTLIGEAHARGTDMYDWITGLVNYRQAVKNPTKFQYGADGQLLIYSSRVWDDNIRLAVAKIAPYTVEDAAEWGEQISASVDMFGWDGCRWDWGWLPSVPNDPLYHNVEGTASKDLEWFNWEGKSCWELYPNPDQTAYECYKAWIGKVREKHPNFVNTANSYPTADQFADGKKYMAEFLRDGMALLEYLIGFDGKESCNTFAKWTKQLAEDSNRVRKVGCHTEVGSINNFALNSPMTQYARYACHAAGSKWWGGPGDSRYWTARRRALPFAMRFSEYFWSTEFLQVEDEAARTNKVTVIGGNNLLWKDFVFERVKGDVRELVVHVVNVGGDEHFYVRHAPSPPVENLQVGIRAEDGERDVECWALLPGDEPTAVRLEINQDNGIVTLPKLEEAATFVFRFRK